MAKQKRWAILMMKYNLEDLKKGGINTLKISSQYLLTKPNFR